MTKAQQDDQEPVACGMSFDSKPMKPYEHPFGDPSHIMSVQMSNDLQKASAALMLGDVLLNNMVNEVQRLKAQRDELLEALELLIDDLALRAKLRGDDCLDVSDSRLIKAQEAILKAKGK